MLTFIMERIRVSDPKYMYADICTYIGLDMHVLTIHSVLPWFELKRAQKVYFNVSTIYSIG